MLDNERGSHAHRHFAETYLTKGTKSKIANRVGKQSRAHGTLRVGLRSQMALLGNSGVSLRVQSLLGP